MFGVAAGTSTFTAGFPGFLERSGAIARPTGAGNAPRSVASEKAGPVLGVDTIAVRLVGGPVVSTPKAALVGAGFGDGVALPFFDTGGAP